MLINNKLKAKFKNKNSIFQRHKAPIIEDQKQKHTSQLKGRRANSFKSSELTTIYPKKVTK